MEASIGAIAAPRRALRHFQLTALSKDEIAAALRFAVDQKQGAITLVSHSFELLSRDRLHTNLVLKHRFEALCTALARIKGLHVATYAADPPQLAPGQHKVLPHSWPRTAGRLAEQAIANALYGGK
jgi:hypothetical protein